MDFAALFKVFQSWGPSAISSVLVFVVLYLIRKVDKNGEDDKKRAKDFQDSLESKIKELREETARVLDEHGRKISYIEKEYTRNDFFLRELSGWKGEINRLSDQISSQFMAFTQNIIQVLNPGKK